MTIPCTIKSPVLPRGVHSPNLLGAFPVLMKLDVMIVGVNHETWFRGTRDERQVIQLNCLDRSAFLGLKLKTTFDYSPSADEASEIKLESLDGATVSIGVSEIRPGNAGRLTIRGKIDRSTVPAECLVNGAKPVSPAVKQGPR